MKHLNGLSKKIDVFTVQKLFQFFLITNRNLCLIFIFVYLNAPLPKVDNQNNDKRSGFTYFQQGICPPKFLIFLTL